MLVRNILNWIDLILIIFYLIFGIDDMLWLLISGITRLKNHKNREQIDLQTLNSIPPKTLAVMIASWHEEGVIGDVVKHMLSTSQYPRSMYHIFVGVYPNDIATIEAVRAISKDNPHVHAIINYKNGPTTKAQNLNYVISQIREYEKENNIRFAAVTVHDSEDVVHPYEMLMTNYLIDKHDVLQYPVFPILRLPTFKNFFSQLTTATYADEFAENHYLTVLDRYTLGAFVPCAGTGFVISGRLLDKSKDADILPTSSLTEDYLFSLKLYEQGVQMHYVLNRLPRVLENGKVKLDFVATRSLFPATFKAAVKQKTRWIYGITMQSIGFRKVFLAKNVSFVGRYTFYKDAKARLANLVLLAGYVAALYSILATAFGLEPLFVYGTVNYDLTLVLLTMTVIRQICRGYALYRVYGFRSVFFGCLLPPIFPIRMIYGNIINLVATLKAYTQLFTIRRSDREANKQNAKEAAKALASIDAGEMVTPDRRELPSKKTVRWSKTEHEFLSKQALERYYRHMGDTLIDQKLISPKDLKTALSSAKEQHTALGKWLISKQYINEDDMLRSLAMVKHLIYVPDTVAEKLPLHLSLSKEGKMKCQNNNILTMKAGDDYIVAVDEDTTPEKIEGIKEELGQNTCMILVNNLKIKNWLDQVDVLPEGCSEEAYVSRRYPALAYEQEILSLIYSSLTGKNQSEILEYMGLEACAQ